MYILTVSLEILIRTLGIGIFCERYDAICIFGVTEIWGETGEKISNRVRETERKKRDEQQGKGWERERNEV